MAYELRKRSRKPKDYSEYTNKLPRLSRTSGKPRKDNKLYELEVLEEDDLHGRVKVHYLGYDSQHDEWRDRDDIVSLQPRNEGEFMIDNCLLSLRKLCYHCYYY